MFFRAPLLNPHLTMFFRTAVLVLWLHFRRSWRPPWGIQDLTHPALYRNNSTSTFNPNLTLPGPTIATISSTPYAPLAVRRGKSSSGLELKRLIIEHSEYPDIPTAFCGSSIDRSPRFDAFPVPSFTDHETMLLNLKSKCTTPDSGVSQKRSSTHQAYQRLKMAVKTVLGTTQMLLLLLWRHLANYAETDLARQAIPPPANMRASIRLLPAVDASEFKDEARKRLVGALTRISSQSVRGQKCGRNIAMVHNLKDDFILEGKCDVHRVENWSRG